MQTKSFKNFKKVLFYFLFFTISISVFLGSCSKNEFPNVGEKADFNALSKAVAGEHSVGEVCIKTTQKQQILVTFRSQNQNLVTQVYVLQLPQEQTLKEVSIIIPQASVIYAKEGLFIANRLQKQHFFLGLSNEAGQNILKAIETEGNLKAQHIYKGFGLSAMQGSWDMKNTDKIEGAFAYIIDKKVAKNNNTQTEGTPHDLSDGDNPNAGGACASGGRGATSCSSGAYGVSCSVACGTGYYACCNLATCYCVANP